MKALRGHSNKMEGLIFKLLPRNKFKSINYKPRLYDRAVLSRHPKVSTKYFENTVNPMSCVILVIARDLKFFGQYCREQNKLISNNPSNAHKT